jgi:hypothetical protein
LTVRECLVVSELQDRFAEERIADRHTQAIEWAETDHMLLRDRRHLVAPYDFSATIS